MPEADKSGSKRWELVQITGRLLGPVALPIQTLRGDAVGDRLEEFAKLGGKAYEPYGPGWEKVIETFATDWVQDGLKLVLDGEVREVISCKDGQLFSRNKDGEFAVFNYARDQKTGNTMVYYDARIDLV